MNLVDINQVQRQINHAYRRGRAMGIMIGLVAGAAFILAIFGLVLMVN